MWSTSHTNHLNGPLPTDPSPLASHRVEAAAPEPEPQTPIISFRWNIIISSWIIFHWKSGSHGQAPQALPASARRSQWLCWGCRKLLGKLRQCFLFKRKGQ